MKFVSTVFTIFYWLSFTPAFAESSEIITYESLSSRVGKNNPELAAARYRIDEAVGNASQSGRLSNPTFDTGISHNIQSAEGAIEIGFSQKFPLTNRLSLEKEIGLQRVKAAEAEVRNVERLLIAEAREAFVKVLSIRERKELMKQQKKLAQELSEFISEASQRGEISTLEAAQSRLAALRLTTEERRLETHETSILGTLRPIIGLAPETAVVLSGSAPPIVLPKKSQPTRPDLTAEQTKLQAAEAGIALEQANRQEDLQAAVFAAGERVQDAPEGLENETLIGFKVSIPLPFWNDNQGNIDAATARRNQQQEKINALNRDIRHQIQVALTEMQQWAALVSELDDTLLPLAKEQTDLLEEAYLQGQGNLQSVLISRDQSLELLAAKIDAVRELQLAQIRYHAALGKP